MAYKLNSAKDSHGDEQLYMQLFTQNRAAIEQYKRQHGGDLEHAFQAVVGKPWPSGRSVKIHKGVAEMTKDRTVKSVLGKYVAPIAGAVAAPFVLPALFGAGGAGGLAAAQGIEGAATMGITPALGGSLGVGAVAGGGLGAGTGSAIMGGLKGLLTNKFLGAGLAAAGGLVPDKRSSETSPTMDPTYTPLRDHILDLLTQRLNGSADLSGYAADSQQNINHTFDLIKQSQGNDLTARGLSTSPVAGAVDAARENARAGQSAQFLNSLPLLQRELQAKDLAMGSDFLNFGKGSSTEAESGGGLGGGISQLAQYMGYLTGKGAFAKPGASASPAWA